MGFWGNMFAGSDDDRDLRLARGRALLGLSASMYNPHTGLFDLNAGIQGLGESLQHYQGSRIEHEKRLKKIEEERAAVEKAARIRQTLSDEHGMNPDMLAAVPDSQLASLWLQEDRAREKAEWKRVEGKADAIEKQRVEGAQGTAKANAEIQLREAMLRGVAPQERAQLEGMGATFEDVKRFVEGKKKKAVDEMIRPPKPAGGTGKPKPAKPTGLATVDPEAVFVNFTTALSKADVGEILGPDDQAVQAGAPPDALFAAAVNATKGIKDPAARQTARDALIKFGQWRTPTGGVDVQRIVAEGAGAYTGGMRPDEALATRKGELQAQLAAEYAKRAAAMVGGNPNDPELRAEIEAIIRAGGAALKELQRELGLQ